MKDIKEEEVEYLNSLNKEELEEHQKELKIKA